MAEIEFSVSGQRILRRRIAGEGTLRQHVQALERHRDEHRAPIDWRFSTEDARIELHYLYPTNN